MRQIIITTSIILVSIILMTSCRNDRYFIKGEGSDVVNSRNHGQFNGVSLSMSANVEIIRDSSFRIELHGQQNILNVIETRISGNVLKIGLQRGTSIRKHNPITIKVYIPSITEMDISGSGDMICVNEFSSSNLSANVSGSGNITFRGNISNSFDATISGSGSIRNTGSGVCRSARYNISGSGDIFAEWFKVEDIDATISGSGDQWIYALNTLNARISGSGNIKYRGNPSINVSISGSGKLQAIQ